MNKRTIYVYHDVLVTDVVTEFKNSYHRGLVVELYLFQFN